MKEGRSAVRIPRAGTHQLFCRSCFFLREPTQRSAAEAEKKGMAKKTKPTTSAITLPTNIARTAPEAFEAVREEIEAVSASDFVHNNLDQARAARRGIAVADRIEPLLPALALLPDFDFRAVSNLRCYALAVLYTHDLATEGGEAAAAELAVLLQEAMPLRELMLGGAELLALAGYVSKDRVAAIRSGQGHADTAGDLLALGRMYLELWKLVKDKVPVTRAMAERAIELSADMNAVIGVREIEDEDPLAEKERDPSYLRAQAFTLFVRAYMECRRGVAYVRCHHGDAGAIVPTLYAKRRRGEVVSDAEDEVVEDEVLGPGGVEETEPSPEESAMTADALVDA